MEEKDDALISGDARKALRRDFGRMKEPVQVILFTKEDDNRPYNEFCLKLLRELGEISEMIRPSFEQIGGDMAARYNVDRSPTMLVGPDRYGIRFTGAPAGEEARSLVLSIIMASTGETFFSDDSKRAVAGLRDRRSIRVFVSPSCPYCPLQTGLAVSAAVERPGLVSAEIVEISENRDLAERYDVSSVPQTFIGENLVGMGLQPEEVFIGAVLSAAPVETVRPASEETASVDLLIAGAGPAGLTAAIYAGRSGLKTVVLDKSNVGGQVAITPTVENYPGFSKIAGKTLMDMTARQASEYAEVREGEEVIEAEKTAEGFKIRTNKITYAARAILIATGVEARKLGVPGEVEFKGKGVSWCAACDGYFFRDGRKVFVVGGGNTAATDALYLKNIGTDVSIIHRRDRLRSERYLQQGLSDNKVPVILNSEVREIRGDRRVTSVIVENTAEKTVTSIPAEGVFIAIGYSPSSELAGKLGVEFDAEGYIKTDNRQKTSVEGVYAAGDITGGLKQIVTAVSQGAVAANTVFEDLSGPYWKDKRG